jgi:hypothetical protein
MAQRVYQIACGYPEAVASNWLRNDAAIKCSCDQLPFSDDALAGQSTMSRLENSASRTDIYRMTMAMVDIFLDSFSKKPRRLVLDLDETCDATHGAQQQSLFQGFYWTMCYLPLHIYESTTGRLVTTILRPGKTPSGKEIAAILNRLIERIRTRWPHVEIIIRGDSHYGKPEAYEVCEAHGVYYLFGLGTGPKIRDMALESWWKLLAENIGDYRAFTEIQYQAQTWNKGRRILVRVDAKAGDVDLRFVVTNMPQKNPKYLYDKLYCQRGRAENLIKDHKNGLRSDLTSCSSFTANCFRLLLHSAAYVLMHHLREHTLRGTVLAGAMFDTLRLKLLKVGARIIQRSKVIRFHLPTTYVYQQTFALAHSRLCNANTS